MAGNDMFIDRLYREAITVMEEAKLFMGHRRTKDADEFDPQIRLALTMEYMRVSCRLMQASAWLMAQKGVETGELTPTEASSERFYPGAENVCLGGAALGENDMPRGLTDLLERSLSIYNRTLRLAEQTRGTLNGEAVAALPAPSIDDAVAAHC